MPTLITHRCPACRSIKEFEVTAKQQRDYQDGWLHVQTIFPEMSADDRERLITGYCKPCWASMFSDQKG